MISALAFLTVLPVGRASRRIDGRTLVAFPLVGVVVGLAWWAAAAVGTRLWAPFVAAGLVLLVDLVLTGGLHVDAIADVADGVASRQDGEQLREVMVDPRTGGLGAATLVVGLLLRVAVLTLLLASGHAPLLVLAPVVGRAGMVVALAASPRTPGSLASTFAAAAGGPVMGASLALGAAVVLVVAGLHGRFLLPLVAAALGIVAAATVGAWWRRRGGFASGDVVGSAGFVAETVALLALAA